MRIQNSNYPSIEQLQEQYLKPSKRNVETPIKGGSFAELLQQKVSGNTEEITLKFSKHAASRLAERDITLTDGQLERLQEGTQKASEKGIQESLVIVDSLAFIVNVPSNTVITAMEQAETNKNVYTNIDGAVII